MMHHGGVGIEIGDWKATRGLNEAYRAIRRMGLESNIAELDAFGFTVIEGAARPELVDRLKAAITSEVEEKTGTRPEVVDGRSTVQGMHYRNHLLGKDPALLHFRTFWTQSVATATP
jgi:hypothetical protein